jgi:hypothetical protein
VVGEVCVVLCFFPHHLQAEHSLVAPIPCGDLLICAKHLFVAAMVGAIAPAGGSKDEQSQFFSPEF